MKKKPLKEIGAENQKKRARKAIRVLNASYDPYDTRSSVVDMLTDLRHLCDVRKIDLTDVLNSSYQHYLEEKKGEEI